MTTDGGGNSGLINEGGNGYVLKKSVKAFADKLEEVFNDPSLYKELSNQAGEYSKNFGIKEYTLELLKVYSN